jgi:phosphoribosylformylglycinamidine cyclo-ligase
MLQVFNMGCRMEIYTSQAAASTMIEIAQRFGVEARIIGRVEASDTKTLSIQLQQEEYVFS